MKWLIAGLSAAVAGMLGLAGVGTIAVVVYVKHAPQHHVIEIKLPAAPEMTEEEKAWWKQGFENASSPENMKRYADELEAEQKALAKIREEALKSDPEVRQPVNGPPVLVDPVR